ncbi:MAG: hypothetical protein MAG453_02044 [Calditrichaeota bacterium]|nr:hypothetical protein [Calditrichota bacterium]
MKCAVQVFQAVVLVVVGCVPVVAQPGWGGESHGTCSPNGIATDSSGQRIVLSLRAGGVWLTNDGGQNWEQINDRLTDSESLQTVVDDGGYLAGFGPEADTLSINIVPMEPRDPLFERHSLDGGETWTQFNLSPWWPDTLDNLTVGGDPTVILTDRAYVSRQAGFALSDDGGATWTVIDINHLHSGIEGMFFEQARPDTIYLYGYWGPENGSEVGGVIASFDGGWSWQRLTPMEELTESEGSIRYLVRGTGEALYAVTTWYPGYPHPPILKSPDNGTNWEWLPDPVGLPESSVHRLMAVPERPGRLLVGSGPANGVWETNDDGETWHRLLRGLPDLPARVWAFHRNQYSGRLYIGLDGQGLFKSTDFGDSWQQVPAPPVGGNTPWDNWRGLIAGEGGVLHCTVNGRAYGATGDATVFQPFPLIGLTGDQQYGLIPVAFTDEQIIISRQTRDFFNPVDRHSLVTSSDAGSSWEVLAEQTYEAWDGPTRALPVGRSATPDTVVAYTEWGDRLYLTEDGGVTWVDRPAGSALETLNTNGANLYAKRITPPADFVRSTDLGASWEALGFPASASLYMPSTTAPLMLDDTLFVRAEEYCWIYVDEGGWSQRGQIESDLSDVIYMDWGFVAGPADTFLVAGSTSRHSLYVSYDYCHSWTTQDVEMPGEYSKENCLNLVYDRWRDRLWVDAGVGLAYLDDPTSAVGEEVWRFQPATFVTLDAYPNPFNTTATVRYTLAKPGEVTLDVYDLLGRRVASLADGLRAPGAHTVTFDASSLASGPYFLRLTAGERSATRKITLAK